MSFDLKVDDIYFVVSNLEVFQLILSNNRKENGK